jgi:hypothetical protein
MGLDNIILSEETQSKLTGLTKEHTWYALTDKCILAQKLRIPKIQFTDNMKFKKMEEQNVVLLRRGKSRHGKKYEDKVWSRE